MQFLSFIYSEGQSIVGAIEQELEKKYRHTILPGACFHRAMLAEGGQFCLRFDEDHCDVRLAYTTNHAFLRSNQQD